MFLTIIIFIITLLFLVVSHEFGHFIVAKKFGVKVLEFGFGIPPKVWGKRIGETLVSINWLPIGGFVRLFGEDETDKEILNDKRSFAAKTVGQRMGIVTAGVVMNFILAAVIFWVVLTAQGFKEQIPLLVPHNFVGVNQSNEIVVVVGKIAPGSPAEKAGIKSGDRITRLNEVKLQSGDQLIEQTKEAAGKSINLVLVNPENQDREIELTPRTDPPEGEGPLGVEIGSITFANLSYQTFPQRLFSGITHSYNLASYSLVVLGNMISQAFESRNLEPVSGSVAGPVGLTNIANMVLETKSPLIPYLNLVALFSLNLAIINILPFPALDGGRLFFLLIEGAFGRRVKPEVERWIHTAGMALLIALIILITFSDIKKFF